MAVLPMKPVPVTGDDHPWLKDMKCLVDRALFDRNRHQPRIADCYKYALPWRHVFYATQPGDSYDEIFDSTVATTLEDFAADMQNTFTPQKNNWLEEQPAVDYDNSQRRAFADDLKKRQAFVFAEMGRSNLYQALQESYSDLGPGTMVLCVTDIDLTKPLHCESLPITDVLLAKGPYGTVDPFRRRKYLRREAEVMWPNADWALVVHAAAQLQKGSEQELEITDGCWRDWADKANETYRYAVECNGKIIFSKEYRGAGSCPFIVARWARDNTTAWGVGPTYRVLPDIKTLNHVRFLDLKNYDKHVDPPTSYEDDGVANIDNGVTPGLWIPRAPGSEPPKAIESMSRFDVAVFERDELRSAVKRAHYQDKPEQLGKTPPTATQWVDEAAERARRMGTPATNLVQELQIPLYRRFAYLLEQRGKLPRVEFDGQEVALTPVSPLLRAQQQEEVVRNDKWVELLVARFGPQLGMVIVDVTKYADRQRHLLGVDKDLIRDEAKMVAAIEQLLPVLQSTGFLPGATPDVGVPAALPAGAV
jgi:hypothetical protein